MDPDSVELFYENLGFELATIDDMDTLFLEIDEDGHYATVTNYDGHFPESLDDRIIFSLYNDDDSFQWSTSLDNSSQLGLVLTASDDLPAALSTLQSIRKENIDRYNEEAAQGQ